MIIYGIKNCDKVRAALKQNPEASLHDFRVDGIDEALVQAMLSDIDLGQLVNKRSTTWKQLTDVEKADVTVSLLCQHPTLIKRPVVFENKQYRIGV